MTNVSSGCHSGAPNVARVTATRDNNNNDDNVNSSANDVDTTVTVPAVRIVKQNAATRKPYVV